VENSSAGWAGSRRELRLRVDANGESLAATRRVLNQWTTDVGVPSRQRGDVVLATYEAMANAVEHGYRGQGGMIELHAHHTGDAVVVTVTDQGEWRPPPADNGTRGRGLPLIEALSDRSSVVPATTGTTVVMTWSCATSGGPHT